MLDFLGAIVSPLINLCQLDFIGYIAVAVIFGFCCSAIRYSVKGGD